ncbi:MAG: amidase [Alphaproteobacteria bacterium]|nr:amidase [Alphaproteobacteria bacterium]
MDLSLERLTATELCRMLGTGAVSGDEVLAACLARIGARESIIRAWAHLPASYDPPSAGAGPLAGIPVGIKDVYDTAEMPTEYGSPIFAGHRPARDCVMVARLRAAGAVILGKTATTEFAYFRPAGTANPHDPSRTPGGSSSGSAAAVADAMVPVALGTQTAGSTIRPAAYCGIHGYKPTFGLIDMTGVKPLSPSLDTAGIFARSVDDLALIGSVLSEGRIPAAPGPPANRPRLAFFAGPYWPLVSDETRVQLARLRDMLSGHATIRDLEIPALFGRLDEAQKSIMSREAAEGFGDLLRRHADMVSPQFTELCRAGEGVDDAAYADALALKAEAAGYLASHLGEDEVIVTAAAPGVAPEISAGTGDPACNRIWTLLGTPCINVPLPGKGRLPLGVQLVGLPGRDRELLMTAAWLSGRLRGAG